MTYGFDISRRGALGLLLSAGGATLLPRLSFAQHSWPAADVSFIVPVSPGGSTDKVSRTLGERLGPIWGRSVIVENVTGAGGAIGAGRVAKAAKDGQTLLVHGEAIVLNTILQKDTPYALEDLTPVVRIARNAQILVVNPKLNISSVEQYVALAKERSGGLTVGLPTSGGIGHIAHEMFAQRAGISVNYIPYAGGAPAATDVMGGHIDATMITLAAVTEFIKAGKLTPIAVTTSYRAPAVPNVPTLAESGFEGFDVESWQGILAPSGTPADVIAKINADVNGVLADPAAKAAIEAMGFGIGGGSAEELAEVIRKSKETYAEVIKTAKIELR